MHQVTLVGLSDDGAALVLTDDKGGRYLLSIDERLRSATRGGRARLDSDAPVTARDIQARLRAGATPVELAETSGWELHRIEAFAAPVLQERGWIAEKAQACKLGRRDEDPPLGELVERRLAERGITAEDTRWDSWRRDDALWTVLLAYPAGQGDRVATWTFDPEAGALTAEDDEARWFTTEPAPEPAPTKLFPVAEAEHAGVPPHHPAARALRNQQAKPAPQPQSARRPAPSGPAAPPPGGGASGKRWDEVLFGAPED